MDVPMTDRQQHRPGRLDRAVDATRKRYLWLIGLVVPVAWPSSATAAGC